jgi:hypothetical protein
MHSSIFRSLSEVLAAHLPHLRAALVRTEDGTVVARVDAADRDNSTSVVISFEAPPPEPEPEPKPRHDPNRWRHLGDPPGTVLVNRSGHTPTPTGWQSYPIDHGGDHYAGAPVNRQWSVSRLDGERLATLADLPAVIRFLREGGY